MDIRHLFISAIAYSISNALMIVAIRELYMANYDIFLITSIISTISYGVLLKMLYSNPKDM